MTDKPLTTREKIEECNYIEAYQDYHGGAVEQTASDVQQLQRALTALGVVLAETNVIDLDDFFKEV